LAGTGLLQSIQILSYFHLFSPKLINLDEPDSHLHPNNQRLLCSLLSLLAVNRDVQVLITTHSRHVIDTMYSDAKINWVRDGSVTTTTPEDQIEILLELGALDIREKISAGKYKVILLTEDRLTSLMIILLRNSKFDLSATAILPYNGVTSPHLLKPLVRQIKDLSNANIIVHRDRDYLEQNEIESWKKQIIQIGAEPFVTSETDIEGYFCSRSYIESATTSTRINVDEITSRIITGEEDGIIAGYVNGRIDIARKAGTIGQTDIGKISAEASREVRQRPFELMKGKKRLAKLRKVMKEEFNVPFEIKEDSAIPFDADLSKLGAKIFNKK
jgi:energy-coupling factor transporter ATP-binding protein EcfA2